MPCCSCRPAVGNISFIDEWVRSIRDHEHREQRKPPLVLVSTRCKPAASIASPARRTGPRSCAESGSVGHVQGTRATTAPKHAAVNPPCRRFDEEAGVPDIQAAPVPTPLALVVERTPATTNRAPLSLASFRPHVGHHTTLRVPRPGSPAHCLPDPECGAIHSDQARRLAPPPVRMDIEIVVRGGVPVLPAGGGLPDRRDRERDCFVSNSSPPPRRGPVTRRGGASMLVEQAA